MQISTLISSLRNHSKKYPLEREYVDRTISWIEKYRESAFAKDNLEGHITASLLITNPLKTKVLIMLHKKLQFWVQFGGHCDGEIDVRSVALREFHEESGIFLEPTLGDEIFDVHIHTIPLSQRGVPAHTHFDILFLGMIPENTPYSRQESEVDDIRWFDIEGIEKYIAEPRMLYMIGKIKNL